jgi:hypothetical protein
MYEYKMVVKVLMERDQLRDRRDFRNVECANRNWMDMTQEACRNSGCKVSIASKIFMMAAKIFFLMYYY